MPPEVDWGQFSQMLKALARQRDSKGLEDALYAFGETVADYLQALAAIGAKHEDDPFSMAYTTYRPPTPHSIEYHELVEVTVAEGDRACLDALLMTATRLTQTAFDEANPPYFTEALLALYRIYQLGRDSERFGEYILQETADHLRMVSQNVLGLYIFGEGRTADTVNHLYPYVQRLLNIWLSLLRLSTENHDGSFFDRLMDTLDDLLQNLHIQSRGEDLRSDYDHLLWQISIADKHRETENNRSDLAQKKALQEESLTISDLRHQTVLIIAAWCIDLVRVTKLTRDEAKGSVERALWCIGNLRDIIEVYLFMDENLRRDDHGLGYEHWDHEPLVPGKGRARWGTAWDNWVKTGWVVAALRVAAGTPDLDPKSVRLIGGIREHGYQELASAVNEVLKQRDTFAWLLGHLDLDAAAKNLLGVLSALRDRQETQDCAELAKQEIDAEKVEAFARECAKEYASSRSFANLLKRLGGSAATQPRFCPVWPPSLVFRRWFLDDKNDFVKSPYTVVHGREICARNVGARESIESASWIEDSLNEAGTIPDFEHLVSSVRKVASTIQNAGFQPNVVMIPSDWRYEATITDVPDWQRQSPFKDEAFPEWVGQIDEMHVFIWPHRNAKSVAVMDIGRLISWRETIHTEGTPLKVEIGLPTEADIRSWLSVTDDERQKDLSYAGDLETLRRTKVVGLLYADVLLGIADPAAGANLAPTGETMGVVYEEGGDTYHLPECETAKAIPADKKRYYVTVGIARAENSLKPCSSCSPNYPPH